MALVLAALSVASYSTMGDMCATDADCQLNGQCTAVHGNSFVCICDKGWVGDDCGVLDVEPGVIAYDHGQTTDTSCWGGGPPYYDAATELYHLYLTEIAGHCGMSTWARMSQATHATSPNVTGPFTKVDVAVGTFTHNVYYAYNPKEELHLLYHIGAGTNPSSCNPYFNCTNGTTPHAKGIQPPDAPWPPATCPLTRASNLHYSKSLSGPWMDAGPLKLNPDVSVRSVSNPSPWIFPNGTVMFIGRTSDGERLKNGTLVAYHNIWMYKADSWNSTYNFVPGLGVNGSVNVGNGIELTEDPVLWYGRRGFHIIFHSQANLTHAWSVDGYDWRWSHLSAATNMVIGPNRDPITDHERPRVVVDDDGDLSAVYIASLSDLSSYPDDASHLLSFKTRTPSTSNNNQQ
eukprot:m.137143 g.137143  ORF g.137143 m.137143 type:complete len:403 (-) comp29908_c0_seq2:307-1515(-)